MAFGFEFSIDEGSDEGAAACFISKTARTKILMTACSLGDGSGGGSVSALMKVQMTAVLKTACSFGCWFGIAF